MPTLVRFASRGGRAWNRAWIGLPRTVIMFVQLFLLKYANCSNFWLTCVPIFRLWLPVTYDIEARTLVLVVDMWNSVPWKMNPMLRDIVDVVASNTPGRSGRALMSSRPVPRIRCTSVERSGQRLLTGCMPMPTSNRMRLVCGLTHVSW